jgi:hypothetical protein
MGFDDAGFLIRCNNMLGKAIISIIFIPVNALILWLISGIKSERESYKKALLAASVLFLLSLLHYTYNGGQGFHNILIFNFIGSWRFIALLSVLVLWLIYRQHWVDLLVMWGIWFLLQILIIIFQSKILALS